MDNQWVPLDQLANSYDFTAWDNEVALFVPDGVLPTTAGSTVYIHGDILIYAICAIIQDILECTPGTFWEHHCYKDLFPKRLVGP